MHTANGQMSVQFPPKNHLRTINQVRSGNEAYQGTMFVALHQENYATIPNYLAPELRYMDAGETRLKSAKS
jgi:hypothetical protein